MLFQRLAGLFMVIANIPLAIWVNDGTAAMMLVPLGLYLLFTKKQVMF